MAVWIPLLLSTLLGAEPATVVKPAPSSKVYVVYVTVVEVDAEGNETVLFTPRVQTTGNPAGATVEHVDGRSFEFNCKLASSTTTTLERPPETTAGVVLTPKPNRLGSKKTAAIVAPAARAASHDQRPVSAVTVMGKSVPPANPPVSREADDFFVRTYDVSDLIEPADNPPSGNAADLDFAPLIQTLKSVAAPDSWTGKASIRPFASSKSLAIKQNEAGHIAVTQALEELRPRSIETTKPSDETIKK